MYYLYMIQNDLNDLYIGISENPEKRLVTHNQNSGADFTKRSNKFRIVFLEKYNDIKSARTREIQIKKWSRKKKDFLISLYKEGIETKQ